MIPRIARRGHSFVGAGLYYLHDKEADTSERVAFTETVNLPMEDAEKALRFMAYSASCAEAKKQTAGISTTGARQTGGAVYSYSLSWHPAQQPDREEMLRCAAQTLRVLGLENHEAVYVAHSDTHHAHIHVIVNLVHPERGTIGDIAFDQRKLQAWALDYEQREGGEILCPEREKNAQRRQQGEMVKYQDARHPLAPRITLLFEQSDCGKEFLTMMEEQGVTVAQGDKGRIVMVDSAGEIQNLTRQLPRGIGKKQVLEKLADVGVERLPLAHEMAKARKKPSESDDSEKRSPVYQEQKKGLTEHLNAVEKAHSSPQVGLLRRQAHKAVHRYSAIPTEEYEAMIRRMEDEDDMLSHHLDSVGRPPVSSVHGDIRYQGVQATHEALTGKKS